MSFTNRCRSLDTDPRRSSHGTGRNLRILCTTLALVTLPFSGGCSPELFVTTVIVAPVLYAHLNQGGPETRQDPARTRTDRPRIHTSPASVNTVHAASSAQEPQAPSSPAHTDMSSNRQLDTISPVAQGALAYRQMQWDDAARILNEAMATGTCTDSEVSKAHVLLGAIEYQQGHLQATRIHFLTAYRHDRQTRPSPELFPPQLVDFYRTVNSITGP